jgi:uncharacterized lipoprotein YehR (DUF1307 family)
MNINKGGNMMKLHLITFTLISSLSGCASHSHVLHLHSELEGVKKSLNELSVNFDSDSTISKAKESAIKAKSAEIWASGSAQKVSDKLEDVFFRRMPCK